VNGASAFEQNRIEGTNKAVRRRRTCSAHPFVPEPNDTGVRGTQAACRTQIENDILIRTTLAFPGVDCCVTVSKGWDGQLPGGVTFWTKGVEDDFVRALHTYSCGIVVGRIRGGWAEFNRQFVTSDCVHGNVGDRHDRGNEGHSASLSSSG
jgi:hypothetical protein